MSTSAKRPHQQSRLGRGAHRDNCALLLGWGHAGQDRQRRRAERRAHLSNRQERWRSHVSELHVWVNDCNTTPRSPKRYCSRHQRRCDRFGDPLGTAPPVTVGPHGTLARYKRGGCRCERCRRSNADRVMEYLHRVHPEMGYHKSPQDGRGRRGRPTADNARWFAERTATIMHRYASGDTLAQIGVQVGLTRERIRQIVKSAGVPMPRDYKCAFKDCDTAPRSPNRHCFQHQRLVARFGDPSESGWRSG